MDKILKIGIIGCGGIANGKHMPALKKVEGVEMVAFCDIIKERAEKAAEEFGAPDAKVYEDYKELLKDESIDVIHVCTPNRSHSFITIDSLEAGKHVMCEKPMAKTYEEAKAMCEAAERTGKKLSIGYQNRQTAENLYIKKCADDGELGEIYYGKALALRRRAVPTWGVFLNEFEQGGGPLIDIGTHALDMTLWVMNNYEPEMVVGQTFRKLSEGLTYNHFRLIVIHNPKSHIKSVCTDINKRTAALLILVKENAPCGNCSATDSQRFTVVNLTKFTVFCAFFNIEIF